MSRYDDIRDRWRRSGADRGWDTTDCACPDEPHQNALHVLADEDVPWLLDRIDLQAEMIDCQDKILAYYRVGRRPSDKVLGRIVELRVALLDGGEVTGGDD